MDILEAIRGRRTIRRFKEESVVEEAKPIRNKFSNGSRDSIKYYKDNT